MKVKIKLVFPPILTPYEFIKAKAKQKVRPNQGSVPSGTRNCTTMEIRKKTQERREQKLSYVIQIGIALAITPSYIRVLEPSVAIRRHNNVKWIWTDCGRYRREGTIAR